MTSDRAVAAAAVERKDPAPILKPSKIGASAGRFRGLQRPPVPTPENHPGSTCCN